MGGVMELSSKQLNIDLGAIKKTVVDKMQSLKPTNFEENDVNLFFDNIGFQEKFWLMSHDENYYYDYVEYRILMNKTRERRIVLDHPLYLLIEPTSVCNLRCPMCFQDDASFTTKEYMGMINFDLFCNLVEEAKDIGVKAITLASRGEPTLHSKFIDMLKFLKNKDIMDVKVNTNATRLNEEKIRAIIENDVCELVLSIDSAVPEEYESLRLGAKFEKTLAAVQLLKKIIDEYPNRKTLTRISGVNMNDKQDWDKFFKFWSQYIDQVGWVPSEMRWDTYNNPVNKDMGPCSYPWERMYVWYDGKANPCDVDYKSLLSSGKYPDLSLKELWMKQAKLRDDHEKQLRSDYVPCDRCGVC